MSKRTRIERASTYRDFLALIKASYGMPMALSTQLTAKSKIFFENIKPFPLSFRTPLWVQLKKKGLTSVYLGSQREAVLLTSYINKGKNY